MLGTCDQIAAGLGAGDKHSQPAPGAGSQNQSQSQRGADKGGRGPEGMGNLRMRMWIGERLVGTLASFVSFLGCGLLKVGHDRDISIRGHHGQRRDTGGDQSGVEGCVGQG